MKKINHWSLFFIIFLFLPTVASANCMWTLHNECKDIGRTNNWALASSESFCTSPKLIGSTVKCCCGADIPGCCKKDNSGNISTNDLTGQECQAITYATTTFYQDQEASGNKCVDKGAPGCNWSRIVTNGVTVVEENCGNGYSKLSDTKCPAPKPADGINSHSICCCPVQQVKPETATPPKFIMPELQINIPGLTLTPSSSIKYSTNDDGSYHVEIPWLSEYLLSLYNYGLAIAGILAAIVLMGGGVLWLISSGDASRITQAKELIAGSITGIIIMFSSYLILIQINPELIKFRPISIGTIKKIDLYALPATEQINAPTSAGSSHGVPWYFQCSSGGKSTPYDLSGQCKDKSTICTSGCGAVSTLMALGKFGVNPSLSTWAKDVEQNGGRTCYQGSNAAGLIKAANTYGIKGVMLNGKDQIAKALTDGHPVIISVRGSKPPCRFTNGGHFIVLTGWREKNNEIADVNDPANSKQITERTWISLKDFGGCSLNQSFYLYKP